MLHRKVIALLLALTPARWRDSIAGDFEVARGGTARTFLSGVSVLARLWAEEIVIARTTRTRRFTMHAPAFHVRHALRALVKRPGYSLLVILTLAAGIGANASVFGLANWLMFRPIPAVRDEAGLVTIRLTHRSGGVFTMAHPEMEALRTHIPAIEAIAGSMEAYFDVAVEGREAQRIDGGIVSANYFEVLGVRPAMGRTFSPSEPGVVVSHEFWRTHLGSADVIGRSMLVNGKPQPLLGVAPRGFTGLTRSSSIDVWVPTTIRSTLFSGPTKDVLTNMVGIYVEFVARLSPGASSGSVRAAMGSATAALARIHPRPQRYKSAQFIVDAGLAAPGFERARLGRVFTLLIAISAMLLILACANVANVMLASGISRRAEFATRQALGASRRRIIGSVLVEGLLLALAGGAAAIALAAGVSILLRGTLVLSFIPVLGEISLDARVFGFALAISTASALVATLLPALAATRVDILGGLKGTNRSVAGGGWRLQRALMVAQVAVSMALLVGAVLIARSVHARRNLDPGFDPSPILTFSVEPGLHGHDAARRRAFYDALITRVRSTPGVASAAVGWSRPYGRMAADSDVRDPSNPSGQVLSVELLSVGAGYLTTMGIPIVAGREFAASDQFEANANPRVVMVSASLATKMFGSPRAAVGRSIVHETAEGQPMEIGRALEIVGVAADVRLRQAFRPPPDAVYTPLGRDSSWATVHVRAAAPATALAPLLRDAVRKTDESLPAFDLMTVREAIERQMAEEVLIGRLTIGVTLLAVLMAAIGLYALLACAVADRRIEIGIRVALGALPARIVRAVTSDAIRMTAAGAIAGTLLASWGTRYLESRLFGIERFDPLTFAISFAIIALVALVAAAGPASRAARVDPVTVLRR